MASIWQRRELCHITSYSKYTLLLQKTQSLYYRQHMHYFTLTGDFEPAYELSQTFCSQCEDLNYEKRVCVHPYPSMLKGSDVLFSILLKVFYRNNINFNTNSPHLCKSTCLTEMIESTSTYRAHLQCIHKALQSSFTKFALVQISNWKGLHTREWQMNDRVHFQCIREMPHSLVADTMAAKIQNCQYLCKMRRRWSNKWPSLLPDIQSEFNGVEQIFTITDNKINSFSMFISSSRPKRI